MEGCPHTVAAFPVSVWCRGPATARWPPAEGVGSHGRAGLARWPRRRPSLRHGTCGLLAADRPNRASRSRARFGRPPREARIQCRMGVHPQHRARKPVLPSPSGLFVHVQTQAPTQSRSATRPSRLQTQSHRPTRAAAGSARGPGGRGTGCRTTAGQGAGAGTGGRVEGTVRLRGPGSQVDVGDLGSPLRRHRGCKLLPPLGSWSVEAELRSQAWFSTGRCRRVPRCGHALPHRA